MMSEWFLPLWKTKGQQEPKEMVRIACKVKC